MSKFKFEGDLREYPVSTPLLEIDTQQIEVMRCSAGTMVKYQRQMSKAVWRPAFGRKLGFFVVHGTYLLGLIFLASPVMCLTARDNFLFPDKPENLGLALKPYLDMSVCVAAQPVGWHWNIGKLLVLIAPTLGDVVKEQYGIEFKGVTTTSLWGANSQYNRIYKYLGETRGFGHAHISDTVHKLMLERMEKHCPVHNPDCADPAETHPCNCNECKRLGKIHDDCATPANRGGSGANSRMRRISAWIKYFKHNGGLAQFGLPDDLNLKHEMIRGIYYHEVVPSDQRQEVIKQWYERWGLPRYLKTKDRQPPYLNGLEGGKEKQTQIEFGVTKENIMPKINKEKQSRALQLIESGKTEKEAAVEVGVTYQTVHRWNSGDSSEVLVLTPETQAREFAKNFPDAAVWLLEHSKVGTIKTPVIE